MRNSLPILPDMREFEADLSLHLLWMKWCQLLHHLWTLVCCRAFPGSRDIVCWIICKDIIFLFAHLVWVFIFFPSPWQQALRRYLPSEDFCSPARFSLFCLPSVKIRHWQTDLVILKPVSTHRLCRQYFLPRFACGGRPLLDSQAHSSTADCMRHDALSGWWEHLNVTWHGLQSLSCNNISDDVSEYSQYHL